MRQSRDKEKFLALVCKSIRARNLHKKIKKELNDHIEDQKDIYMMRGMDEDDALLKAIEEMGDPSLVGKELDQAHRPLIEWTVLITTALFLLISGGMQYLFSTIMPLGGNAETVLFTTFLLYAPIGIIVFAAVYFFDYTLIRKYSWPLYISYILLMIVIFIFSPVLNGAIYYAYFPSLLFVPIFSGLVYNLSNKRYLGIVLSGVVCLPAFIITLYIPSITNTLLMAISCLAILTSAINGGLLRCNTKVALGLVYIPTILTSVLGFLFIIAQSPYRLERFMFMFAPNPDPNGLGYQRNIARYIVSNAKPFGSILIREEPLEKYLPEWSSDFSFAFIIGKLGYIPAIMVTALIFFLLYRLYKVTVMQNSVFGKSLALGCLSILSLQFISSILFNIGIYGIMFGTPPFLSYGPISFIFTMGILGLILSIHRRSNMVDDSWFKPLRKNDIVHFENGKLIIDFNNIGFKR